MPIGVESTSPTPKKGWMAPIEELKASTKDVIKAANEKMDSRRAQGELKDKKAYEKKRQEELKKERWEMENQRRMERAAKKGATRK